MLASSPRSALVAACFANVFGARYNISWTGKSSILESSTCVVLLQLGKQIGQAGTRHSSRE